MPLVLADRVKETSTTTSTGTLTLAGASTGYQSFSAGIGVGNTCYYAIHNQGTNEWEVGLGTVGSGTLSRDTVLASSNSGSLVNFSAGTKDVFVTYPADKAVYEDASGNVSLPANLAFQGTGNRITGDFSNATFANRASFQSSTTNGTTRICVLPNGTSTSTSFNFFNNANPTNSGRAVIGIESTKCYVQASISGTGTYLPLTLETSGSEAMRIDTSGNVGIGGPPDYKLDIYSGALRINGNARTVAGDASIYFGSTTNNYIFGGNANNIMAFGVNGSEKMRIDSSGNVGIGTSSIQGKFNVASGRSFFGANSETYSLGVGYTQARVNSGQTYYIGATDSATPSLVFSSSDGTERMRIDSSGNVGIGTSSPLTRLHVVGASNTGSGVLVSNQGTNVAVLSNEATWLGTGTSNNAVVSSFGATSLLLGTNAAERMRIDASGNVGIGTSSPAAELEIKGTGFVATQISGDSTNETQLRFATNTAARVSQQSNQALIFDTNATERMRLSAAGGLSVGTTADPGAGAIYATGNITAYYTSDIKFKENVKDVDNALDKVCAIGSKTFDWTDEYIDSKGGEDGYFVTKSDFGVIAQDVQAVFPQAVRTREDGTLAVDYEKLATLAFGAIKELVKRVEALEAK